MACRRLPCAAQPLVLAVPHYTGPLLTRETLAVLQRAASAGHAAWTGSLDLGRSEDVVTLDSNGFVFRGTWHAFPAKLKDRTLYYREGNEFEPISRYGTALIKLVPTGWGAPTFEIDGIKMLPSAKLSPYDDARRKVELVAPAGKQLLDTCGGLGYFAACSLDAGVASIRSFEKNPDVLWLRTLNPWSPDPEAASAGGRLHLTQGDVSQEIEALAADSFDAILHDPPRFGIAGELYSQVFYDHLARVLRKAGRLFHYTGTPNRLTSGRDVPREVSRRLEKAGFRTGPVLDGVLAIKR